MFNIMPQMQATPNLMDLAMRQIMQRHQQRAIHPYQQALEQQKYESGVRAAQEAPLAHDTAKQRLADMRAQGLRAGAQEQRTAAFEPQRIALAKAQAANASAQAFARMHPEEKNEVLRSMDSLNRIGKTEGWEAPKALALKKYIRNKLNPKSAVNISLGGAPGVPGSLGTISGGQRMAITPGGVTAIPGTGQGRGVGRVFKQGERTYAPLTQPAMTQVQSSLIAGKNLPKEIIKYFEPIAALSGAGGDIHKGIAATLGYAGLLPKQGDYLKKYRASKVALDELPMQGERFVRAYGLKATKEAIRTMVHALTPRKLDTPELVQDRIKLAAKMIKERTKSFEKALKGVGAKGGYEEKEAQEWEEVPATDLKSAVFPTYRRIKKQASKTPEKQQTAGKYTDADIRLAAKKHSITFDQSKKLAQRYWK